MTLGITVAQDLDSNPRKSHVVFGVEQKTAHVRHFGLPIALSSQLRRYAANSLGVK